MDFQSALPKFKAFLRDQGWSDDILWLTKDRITCYRMVIYLYRPWEMDSELRSQEFYNETRKTKNNLRIDALCEFDRKTVAYVSRLDGESQYLNFGVPMKKMSASIIGSAFQWWIVRVFCRFRPTRHFLDDINMPPNTEQVAAGNVC